MSTISAALVTAAVVLALHLFTLLRYPPPFVDEAWAANRSWALITHGIPFGTLDAGVFEYYAAHRTYFPLLPTALQAAPLWLLGAPLLWPLRLLSLAFGAALLLACYGILSELTGRAAGIAACALIAVSPAFFTSAHLGRWDIMVAAMGYGALALQLRNRSRQPQKAALAGLLIGIAFEFHPHAMVFAPVALALYALESHWHALRRPDLWAWMGGLITGGSVYLLIHVAPYPESFARLAALAHGFTHTPPLFTSDPGLMTRGVTDTFALVRNVNPFWGVAFAISAASLLSRRERTSRAPIVLSALMFVSFSLLVRNKFPYYAIYLTPALDMTIGAFAGTLVAAHRRSIEIVFAHAVVVCLAVGIAVNSFLLLRRDGNRDFQAVLEQIVPLIGTTDTVMGAQTYWFGLTDRRYYSWEQLVYYKRHFPTSTFEDSLRHFRPDVFVLDGHLAQFLENTERTASYSGQLSLPRQELISFLADHGSLIADLNGRSYGRIRVYRLFWTHGDRVHGS